ncbi:MAG: MBL fold metallo-hydrolase [Rhodospirillales bacterium]|nr:MBL fold metallo-hydrolase [Rhodospirillales bacterium]
MNTSLNIQEPFAPPVVESLAVRVVVDSRYERFLMKADHPSVSIEHVGGIPGRQMATLAGEYGLSLHLEATYQGGSSQYMLDFGFTPEVVNRNTDLLDIDLTRINGLILSHGHRDHYGGLSGFVVQHRKHMRDDLSLFVGAEDSFREKWLKDSGEEYVSWGALDRTALTAQNVVPVSCEMPHTLQGGFTSGYIERNSFEKITGGTMVESVDHFTEDERSGKLVLDQHPDEHATCYIVKGRGLVVISYCGHCGLINTVKTAMAVSGVDKLHAVIGGFHLVMSPPDYIDHTISELEALAPDVVLPMHCSGEAFIEAMRRRMPDQLVSSNLGSRFTFGV